MSAFEAAFGIVVGHEGGLDRSPADPGNWTGGRVGAGTLLGTKYGVSAAAYPDQAIATLTLADARAIFRTDFWERVGADGLPPALALLVFDAAVNNGPARAVRWLQSAVGAEPDGIVGPHTLAAVVATIARETMPVLCAEILAERLLFMAALPSWRLFGRGWARRLCALAYQSVAYSEGVA